ncbi:MAG: hypothetical protein HPY45_07565 [Anaerolineae bacterium]|nr:hypothetical protein [Anaerolineae bacterium]
MAAQIQRRLGLEVTIEPGVEGQFDVVADGKTIYSKFKTGRFPEEDDIVKMLGG